jgi:hypothetical protein
LSDISQKLSELELKKQLLVAEENILMRKGLESDHPEDLIKAMSIYDNRNKANNETKSIMVDPYFNNSQEGFLRGNGTLNSYTARNMYRGSPIIRSIIDKRVEQVADFLDPQYNSNETGFIIRKRKRIFADDKDDKMTDEDKRKIELITEFLIRGAMSPELDDICDDFNTWGRKTVKDSLILDKMGTEIVWNNANTTPMGFFAIDAATIFFADNYARNGRALKQKKNESVPKYVQVYNNKIENEYYEEQLLFGIRNPDTALHSNGYGNSELEILVSTVTSMLQGDAYNANIFKVGSIPSGIMRISGNINPTRLEEFKSNWRNEISGYQNSRKMAFVEADKMEYQDMTKSNRDMEYSKYQEYLIKLACAIYKISPEEIGFSLQGGGGMFQDSGKEKTKYSRDSGLKPLLTFLQQKINQGIVKKIDPNFEFVFVGLEPDTKQEELEMDIKLVSSIETLDEVRARRGLKPLPKDGLILNPAFLQSQQMKMQQEQMAGQGNQESDQFMDEESDDFNPFEKSWKDNPLAKDFEKFVETQLVE